MFSFSVYLIKSNTRGFVGYLIVFMGQYYMALKGEENIRVGQPVAGIDEEFSYMYIYSAIK